MSDQVQLEVSDIEVRAAQPKAADSRKLQYMESSNDSQTRQIVHIIKIYIAEMEPLQGSLGLRLFIGDHEVKKYSGFRNGIYFKVHDPGFLATYAGETVRFSADGVQFIDTNSVLPDVSAGAERLNAADLVGELPTQEEVLAE